MPTFIQGSLYSDTPHISRVPLVTNYSERTLPKKFGHPITLYLKSYSYTQALQVQFISYP